MCPIPSAHLLSVTLSPCHLVTLSPCHPVTLSPCHPVTLSPCHLVTLSPLPLSGHQAQILLHQQPLLLQLRLVLEVAGVGAGRRQDGRRRRRRQGVDVHGAGDALVVVRLPH